LTERNTLLAVLAHPDDESLVAGGTLARYAAAGWQTALLCATRGEWGPISDYALADYENLGAVRERELRAACEVLGISWLRFLDLADGGVEAVLGTAAEAPTVEKIVRAIRELRPQNVITFGPDGLYGHADHIAIGQLTTAACTLACDPNSFAQHTNEGLAAHRVAGLLYATAPQGLYPNLMARLAALGQTTHPEHFGVPPENITLTIDIRLFLERKLAALRCHQTQLDDSHAFTRLTPELAAELFGQEFFRRVY
jgi:LmbE family N-acetylglucosaminyl deacetylase